jgi:PBP1b-binding outer membrane lipoprotein LpoB
MKNIFVSLLLISALSIYGCSSDEATSANDSAEASVQVTAEVSQAETMEDIWASALDPAEKAKRVQELLAKSGN